MAAPIVAAAAVEGLSKNKAAPYVLGGLILVSAVGSFFIVRGVLKKIGLIEDKKKQRLIKRLIKLNHFNPSFYEPSKISIDNFRAKEIADQIEEAMSGVGTDEESLYGAVREVSNPHNMSLVSKEYQIRHGESLIDAIVDELNTNEIERLLKTIKA